MTQISEDGIDPKDRFYWICDAEDCYFVREHGAGNHIAKCSTRERAEQITEALVSKLIMQEELDRLRKELEDEKKRHVDLNGALRSMDDERINLREQLAALKKQVEEMKPESEYVPYQRCPICNGTGFLTAGLSVSTFELCPRCNGNKTIPMHKLYPLT